MNAKIMEIAVLAFGKISYVTQTKEHFGSCDDIRALAEEAVSEIAVENARISPMMSRSEIRRRAIQSPENLAERYYKLQEEVRIARERLGPAGWKLLEELKKLREEKR